MTHLSNKNIEEILNISGLVGECATERRFPNILFDRVSALFNSSSAVFYSMGDDLNNNPLRSGHGYNLDPVYISRYQDYYNRFDPCFNGLINLANSRRPLIISTNEAIDNEYDYINTEYYQDFLRPQNLHSSIIFGVGDQQGMLGLFGFQRPKSTSYYTTEDYLKARLFSSQIATGLRLGQVINNWSRSRSIIRNLMEQASIEHYLVLDEDFRCIDFAGNAGNQLGINQNNTAPIERNNTSVKTYLSEEIQDYIKYLLKKDDGVHGGFDHINIFTGMNPDSRIRVDLLDADVQRPLIILIFLNEDSNLVSEARLNDFTLTQRERETVHQVSRGLTSAQIAEKLSISIKTVEHHLSHIYKKTDTHNRTALIRLLSN